MRMFGIRGRIPFLLVAGLAVLLMGCPKKPPVPVKPDEPGKQQKTPVARPAVPSPPPAPAPAPRVKGEDIGSSEKAEKARERQRAMSKFENELVHFDFDRSEITDRYKPVLSRKAAFLRSYSNARIQIEGHCDARGSVQYNLALGDRRANSAKAYLVALGISANRITTISFGEERPLSSGNNEKAWAKNRRAQFVVVGQ